MFAKALFIWATPMLKTPHHAWKENRMQKNTYVNPDVSSFFRPNSRRLHGDWSLALLALPKSTNPSMGSIRLEIYKAHNTVTSRNLLPGFIPKSDPSNIFIFQYRRRQLRVPSTSPLDHRSMASSSQPRRHLHPRPPSSVLSISSDSEEEVENSTMAQVTNRVVSSSTASEGRNTMASAKLRAAEVSQKSTEENC